MKYTTVPVTDYEQNCSIIWCPKTKKAALIDPGGDADKILSVVKNKKLVLDKILLTHGHLDHVSAAKDISSHYDIPIIGPHEADFYWLDLLPIETKMFGFPHAEAFLPHRWLVDGEKILLGKLTLNVIHCPGHTPGHVVFYEPKTKTAFVGDVLFKDSIGRTDFPGGNYNDLINSIMNKLLPLGDDVVFIPGHGEKSTFGREKKFNAYLLEDVT